jgi:hypothetical protein
VKLLQDEKAQLSKGRTVLESQLGEISAHHTEEMVRLRAELERMVSTPSTGAASSAGSGGTGLSAAQRAESRTRLRQLEEAKREFEMQRSRADREIASERALLERAASSLDSLDRELGEEVRQAESAARQALRLEQEMEAELQQREVAMQPHRNVAAELGRKLSFKREELAKTRRRIARLTGDKAKLDAEISRLAAELASLGDGAASVQKHWDNYPQNKTDHGRMQAGHHQHQNRDQAAAAAAALVSAASAVVAGVQSSVPPSSLSPLSSASSGSSKMAGASMNTSNLQRSLAAMRGEKSELEASLREENRIKLSLLEDLGREQREREEAARYYPAPSIMQGGTGYAANHPSSTGSLMGYHFSGGVPPGMSRAGSGVDWGGLAGRAMDSSMSSGGPNLMFGSDVGGALNAPGSPAFSSSRAPIQPPSKIFTSGLNGYDSGPSTSVGNASMGGSSGGGVHSNSAPATAGLSSGTGGMSMSMGLGMGFGYGASGTVAGAVGEGGMRKPMGPSKPVINFSPFAWQPQ